MKKNEKFTLKSKSNKKYIFSTLIISVVLGFYLYKQNKTEQVNNVEIAFEEGMIINQPVDTSSKLISNDEIINQKPNQPNTTTTKKNDQNIYTDDNSKLIMSSEEIEESSGSNKITAQGDNYVQKEAINSEKYISF